MKSPFVDAEIDIVTVENQQSGTPTVPAGQCIFVPFVLDANSCPAYPSPKSDNSP